MSTIANLLIDTDEPLLTSHQRYRRRLIASGHRRVSVFAKLELLDAVSERGKALGYKSFKSIVAAVFEDWLARGQCECRKELGKA